MARSFGISPVVADRTANCDEHPHLLGSSSQPLLYEERKILTLASNSDPTRAAPSRAGGKKSGPSSKGDTMSRIMAAARDEFASHGFRGARIEAIARQASITKQLLFHYYGSKEELYILVLNDAADKSLALFEDVDFDRLSPTEALRKFLLIIFEGYNADPRLPSLILDQTLHNGVQITSKSKLRSSGSKLVADFARILQRGSESGEFLEHLDIERLFVATLLLPLGPRKGKATEDYLGIDFDSEEAASRWRDFSTDLLLSALSRTRQP